MTLETFLTFCSLRINALVLSVINFLAMNIRRISILLSLCILTLCIAASAQLADFNSSGVRVGHIHLVVKDLEKQTQFWTTLGGVQLKGTAFPTFRFPGVYILLRQGDPTGPSDGSSVNHFGFLVKNIAEAKTKIQPFLSDMTSNAPTQAMLVGPDGVRVELHEDAKASAPIVLDHIHLFVTAPKDVQAWYAKLTGGVAGRRDPYDIVTIPGAEIRMNKVDSAATATKGRAIDHIGIDVKNIDDFGKRLEAQGSKYEAPVRTAPSDVKIAFFTDPWGTYVEVNENFTLMEKRHRGNNGIQRTYIKRKRLQSAIYPEGIAVRDRSWSEQEIDELHEQICHREPLRRGSRPVQGESSGSSLAPRFRAKSESTCR